MFIVWALLYRLLLPLCFISFSVFGLRLLLILLLFMIHCLWEKLGPPTFLQACSKYYFCLGHWFVTVNIIISPVLRAVLIKNKNKIWFSTSWLSASWMIEILYAKFTFWCDDGTRTKPVEWPEIESLLVSKYNFPFKFSDFKISSWGDEWINPAKNVEDQTTKYVVNAK